MNNNINNIILKSVGIFTNPILAHPIGQMRVRNIKNESIYLYIYENKIHIYIFVKSEYEPVLETYQDNSISYSLGIVNYIYNTSIYKIKFRPLSYSLNSDMNNNEDFFNDNTLIDVYLEKDILPCYYVLNNDIFNNLNVITCLLYREELNDYIKKFKVVL